MKTALSNKSAKVYKRFLKHFRELTEDPHEFLSAQPERAEKIKSFLKEFYAWNVCEDDAHTNPEILPEIVLEEMDEEQIWQQVEIRNNFTWDQFLSASSQLMSINEDKFALNLKEYESDKDSFLNKEVGSENDEDMLGSDQDSEGICEEHSEDEDEHGRHIKKLKKKVKKSIVDDKFFKLGEMEEFLNAEDEKERMNHGSKRNLQGDGLNYFNEDLSDEEEQNANYRDFFEDDVENEKEDNRAQYRKAGDNSEGEGPEQDKEKNDTIEEDQTNQEELDEDGLEENSEEHSEDENSSQTENQVKSSFEQRQERLRRRIEEFEEQALQEKPWQLKGEILASGRPQNSLLEEVLEFESATRPAPVITEETTFRLEDIIRQRIKDKAWDDVERKVKPIKTPQEFRKQLTLDQEKSKESLAQVYEKEYQKALETMDPNKDESVEEPKQHKEIKELMKTLFNKLDALSNFHYTPKPVAPEPRIITNTPAVNMEEVAPVAVSDATLLAPEEIKKHAKASILGKSERTRTDKNRERRKKKIRQRFIHKAQEERLLEKQKQGLKLSTKEEKGKMMKSVMKNKNVQKANKSADGAPLKSSKAFFTQLQDKVTVKTKKVDRQPPASGMSAKRLKL